MHVRKALTLVLAAVVIAAFLMPLTASATNWSPPFALGAGGLKPSVAIDSKGRQHYVWWNPGNGNIEYTRCTQLGGSNCSAPVSLPDNGNSYYPSIAIDPQDRPNVVFETKIGGTEAYAVFWTRLEGGSWRGATKISNEPYAELADIAIGPQGIIHVSYQSKQGTTAYVYYSESDGSGQFTPAVEVDRVESTTPLTVFAELSEKEAQAGGAPEGQQVSNGLYPRLAASAQDRAHVVWNAPSPYGIRYKFQNNTGWSNVITVANGQKDQTPDIAISPNGSVGILWGTYDDFNAAFAEYNGTRKDNSVNDIDGGLVQSLWPRVAVDCAGKFHFVFQGKTNSGGTWAIYHRLYDSSNNNLGGRETLVSNAYNLQTPVIATTDKAAVIYNNSNLNIADAVTANLGISCGGGPTPTASSTPTNTNTPTPSITPNPNFTPTTTLTPSATPEVEHVQNTDSRVVYNKEWRKRNNAKASDGNYQLCTDGTKCKIASNVQLSVIGSKVAWETAYANTYGKVRVWMDSTIIDVVDMCKPNKNSSKPKFVTLGPYDIPKDGNPHIFSLGVGRLTTPCSGGDKRFFVVDGFDVYP